MHLQKASRHFLPFFLSSIALLGAGCSSSDSPASTGDAYLQPCITMCSSIGWDDKRREEYMTEHGAFTLDDLCGYSCSTYRDQAASSYSAPSTVDDRSPGCCKVCTTGKACGDSCISRSYTCHKAPGCACDG